VVDHFGDPGGVLVVDETGDVKKGVHSVGVQRQYTGTAGRIENAQVAVFLTYAGPGGHALIDRALYVPKSWTADPDRCADAGIQEGTAFAAKPALATAMITAALKAGTAASWVAGDEVYGADPRLRAAVRHAGLGYVLQVAANRRIHTPAGPVRVDHFAAQIPPSAWQNASAGAGSKGQQIYSWAWANIDAEHDEEQTSITESPAAPASNDICSMAAYSSSNVDRFFSAQLPVGLVTPRSIPVGSDNAVRELAGGRRFPGSLHLMAFNERFRQARCW
jgi:SRSO17 transposase